MGLSISIPEPIYEVTSTYLLKFFWLLIRRSLNFSFLLKLLDTNVLPNVQGSKLLLVTKSPPIHFFQPTNVGISGFLGLADTGKVPKKVIHLFGHLLDGCILCLDQALEILNLHGISWCNPRKNLMLQLNSLHGATTKQRDIRDTMITSNTCPLWEWLVFLLYKGVTSTRRPVSGY